MAKERAVVKEPPRERETKMPGDKVVKSGKRKKRAETLNHKLDDAAVDESPEDVSIVDAPNPEDAKSESKKRSTKEKKSNDEEQAEVEADDDDDASPDLMSYFAIDTSSTPVDLATVKVAGAEDEEKPKMPNRATRRRLQLIEQERAKIRKRMHIDEDSTEKEDLVQEKLDKWIRNLDHKAAVRKNRKKAKKRVKDRKARDRESRPATTQASVSVRYYDL